MGRVQQRVAGLVEAHGAVCVCLDVLLEIRDGEGVQGGAGVHVGDAGRGDDGVDVVDAMLTLE